MTNKFPHLAGSNPTYPGLGDPYAQGDNTFDYNRWGEGTKLTLCRVPWDATHNVVDWTKTDPKDYFDGLQNTSKITLNTEINVQPDGVVRLPVPIANVQRWNYLWVELEPMTSASQPLDYADGAALRNIGYFVRDAVQVTPSTTECRLDVDWWTNSLPYTHVSYMTLERGHAPLAAVSADEYLADPLHNNSLLLTEDVNYGEPVITKHSQLELWTATTEPLVCFALSCSLEQLSTMLTQAGTTASDEWTDPMFEDTADRWGKQWQVNNYAWGDATRYKDSTTETTPWLTGSGLPGYTLIAVNATDAEAFLEYVQDHAPQLMQLMKASFAVPAMMLSTKQAGTAGSITYYEVLPLNQLPPVPVELKKADFGYPSEYADLAKLYTSPYAKLTFSDNDGHSVDVRIECTSSLKIDRRVSMAFPYLRAQAFLEGVNGTGSNSLTWVDVNGLEHDSSMPATNWQDTMLEFSIPTYALVADGYKQWLLKNSRQNEAQRLQALNSYHNTVRSGNTGTENTKDSLATSLANTLRSNVTALENGTRSNETGNTNTLASLNTSNTNALASNQLALDNGTRSNETGNTNTLASLNTSNENTLASNKLTFDNGTRSNETANDNALASIDNSYTTTDNSIELARQNTARSNALAFDITLENANTSYRNTQASAATALANATASAGTGYTNASNSADLAYNNTKRSADAGLANALASNATTKANGDRSNDTGTANATASAGTALANANRSADAARTAVTNGTENATAVNNKQTTYNTATNTQLQSYANTSFSNRLSKMEETTGDYDGTMNIRKILPNFTEGTLTDFVAAIEAAAFAGDEAELGRLITQANIDEEAVTNGATTNDLLLAQTILNSVMPAFQSGRARNKNVQQMVLSAATGLLSVAGAGAAVAAAGKAAADGAASMSTLAAANQLAMPAAQAIRQNVEYVNTVSNEQAFTYLISGVNMAKTALSAAENSNQLRIAKKQDGKQLKTDLANATKNTELGNTLSTDLTNLRNSLATKNGDLSQATAKANAAASNATSVANANRSSDTTSANLAASKTTADENANRSYNATITNAGDSKNVALTNAENTKNRTVSNANASNATTLANAERTYNVTTNNGQSSYDTGVDNLEETAKTGRKNNALNKTTATANQKRSYDTAKANMAASKTTADANANRSLATGTANQGRSYATAKENMTASKTTADANANRSLATGTENQGRSYATTTANMTATKTTADANANDSNTTALANAGYSQDSAISAAQNDLRTTQAVAKLSIEAHKNDSPVTVGETAGDPLPDLFGTRGVQVRVQTQPEGAIRSAGSQFLRYGYRLDQAWPFERWSVMTRFSYWQAKDVWLTGETSIAELGKDAIRAILAAGVTVWASPELVCTGSTSENKPL